MRIKKVFLFQLSIFFVCFLIVPAISQAGWFTEKLKSLTTEPVETLKQTSLSETEIGSGLKEALKIGINNAIESTSKPGGYFNNEKIKIPLPEKLQFLDQTLRQVGFGPKIDDFVLSMNTAAESAVPAAQDIFLDALFEMSWEDAKKLLQGSDTAATDYFKDKTYNKLSDAFRPAIDNALQRYDVTDKYDELIRKYQTIPFVSKVNMLSPDDYVISKALDGIFYVLGQEEAKIRTNPAARATELLQKVFQ